MATAAPAPVRDWARRLATKNVDVVDAPVSGGVARAVAGEGLAFAEAMGLDPRACWEVIRDGAAASFMLDDRGARMLDNAFEEPKSALDIFVKDMGLVTDAARRSDYPTPLATVAEQLYLAGQRAGLGRLDDPSLINVVRGARATPVGAAH